MTYPLLADEGSVVIERLGLLNQHIVEQQAHFGKPVEDKHHRLPYPGTIVVDEHGIVTDKWFEESHQVRPSAVSLLADVAGAAAILPVRSDENEAHGIRVAAWLGTDHYRPLQVQRLQVAVDIPEELHVYGDPVPDGFAPLHFELMPREVVEAHHPVRIPDPRPFEMVGFEERFFVHEGRLDLVLPFVIRPETGEVEVELAVGFQACSHTVCHPPTTLVLRLPLDLAKDNV